MADDKDDATLIDRDLAGNDDLGFEGIYLDPIEPFVSILTIDLWQERLVELQVEVNRTAITKEMARFEWRSSIDRFEDEGAEDPLLQGCLIRAGLS